MGFVREGNRRSAQIGHEVQLIRAMVGRGFVVEVETGHGVVQYKPTAVALDGYAKEAMTVVTSFEELDLEHLGYEHELEKMGLDEDFEPPTPMDPLSRVEVL